MFFSLKFAMQSRGYCQKLGCSTFLASFFGTSSPIDHPQKGKVTHGYSKPEDSNKVGEICAYLSGMMWLCEAGDQI